MNTQDITNWFNAHPRARDFLKQGIVWAIGYGAMVATGGSGFVGLGVAACLGWLAAHVHANTVWPVIGSQAPARSADGKFKAK